MMERYEEMNRMREHVMKEVDKDKDAMISFREFVDSTNQKDFEKDEGWDVSVIVRFHFAHNTIFVRLLFRPVLPVKAEEIFKKGSHTPECF